METKDGTLLGAPGGIAATTEADYPALHTFRPTKGDAPERLFLAWALRKRHRGHVAFAHKALTFDLSHLLGSTAVQRWLKRSKVAVHVAQSFVVFRRGRSTWTFADSLRIFYTALDVLLPAFAPEVKKAALPSRRFTFDDARWRARLLGDVQGLFLACKRLEKIIRDVFDVPLSLTMPATALRAARRILPREHVVRPPRLVLDWIRAGAYSGGRIEVYWQGLVERPVAVLDINSAYAWAMRAPFPVGDGSYAPTEPADAACYVGLYRVRVKDDALPPVADKLQTHAFACGEYVTMLTDEEAAFARSTGARVDWCEGWRWNDAEPLLAPFIDLCAKTRARDYAGALGMAVKLAQNGLYGILGMNPYRTDYLYHPEAEDPPAPWVPTFNEDAEEESRVLYERLVFRESSSQMPHWAAIITARVRLLLTRWLRAAAASGHAPYYAHTDSIWCPAPFMETSACRAALTGAYGDLKHEATGARALVVAPGEALLDGTPANKRGETWRIASKGFRAKRDDFLTGQAHTVPQTQIFHAGTALRRGTVGRALQKRVGDYAAIRNRLPAVHRPGPTLPREIQHDVEMMRRDWSVLSWYVGKHRPHLSTATDLSRMRK